ncbi:hypothetical protein KIN20_005577 [Parelaphostrongylus tenuis]|uniref:Uncharacterized protein n=1 Tax=Parelaphostrongylus tenuis TaxID=148309 RepID=A0AAD5QK94_PARTN|nr:hypothetical protein KIN20_005577 [Parelaphostrongylus tenuis]
MGAVVSVFPVKGEPGDFLKEHYSQCVGCIPGTTPQLCWLVDACSLRSSCRAELSLSAVEKD